MPSPSTTARRNCPSCQSRVSPLAAECPVCGLSFAQSGQGRPLLFQASALKTGAGGSAPAKAILAPALGRVAPVELDAHPDPDAEAEVPIALPWPPEPSSAAPLPALGEAKALTSSFWPLVKLEASEALVLILANAVAALLVTWQMGVPLLHLYAEGWYLLLPFHAALSWVFFLVPLVLTGQTPLMHLWSLTLAEEAPERRITFSLLHLVSVCAFPVSFLWMVLGARHQTLAEALSGLEILSRPAARMR